MGNIHEHLSCVHSPCRGGLNVDYQFGQDPKQEKAQQAKDAGGHYRRSDKTYHCPDHVRIVPKPIREERS